MQTANDAASDWHDVIDFVLDASRARQVSSALIDLSEHLGPHPRRRSSELACPSSSVVRVHNSRIGLRPYGVATRPRRFISFIPPRPIRCFVLPVLFVPACVRSWVRLLPQRHPCVGAIATGHTQSVRRFTAHCERAVRFRLLTDVASFQLRCNQLCALATFVAQSWLSNMRAARITDGAYAEAAARRLLPSGSGVAWKRIERLLDSAFRASLDLHAITRCQLYTRSACVC